jgi:hypothetical protein
MEKYEIRYATKHDINDIKEFINQNWKNNHILVREEELFVWQYTSDKLDYIIATDSDNNIQGMLGFISYDDSPERDIATSMWKANPGTGFLGIKILMYLMENEKYRVLFSPGINMRTCGGIYKRMGILTGQMNHWYRLNSVNEYNIAKITDCYIPDVPLSDVVKFAKYDDFIDFEKDFEHEKYVSRETVPYKSRIYIERRYFNHPLYKYMIYGIKVDGINTSAVIVLRVQECNDHKVIRFVDCIGSLDALSYVTSFLDSLMDKENAEYIDMYEKGVSKKLLQKAGWRLVSDTNNIIPNYFSPYEQSNVEINYCTTDNRVILFRGDGDQDRPN